MHQKSVPFGPAIRGFSAALLVTGLAACTGNQTPSVIAASPPGVVALTSEQRAAVEAGVRRTIPNPQTGAFLGAAGRKGTEGSAIDVCGHVRYLDPATAKIVEQPYYVELRTTNGLPVAERGQVGGDPSKLAKVNFMCRKHDKS